MSDDQVPAHYRTARRWLLLLLTAAALAALLAFAASGEVVAVVEAETGWWRTVRTWLPF